MRIQLKFMVSVAVTFSVWLLAPCCCAQTQDTAAKSGKSTIWKRPLNGKFNPFRDMKPGGDIIARTAGNDTLPCWKIPCTDLLWKKLLASASESKILESPKKAMIIKKNTKEIKDFIARGGHWIGIMCNDQPGPSSYFSASLEIPPRSTTQIRHFIGHMITFYIINNNDYPAQVTSDESDEDIKIDVDGGKVLIICDLTNLDKNKKGIYRVALYQK